MKLSVENEQLTLQLEATQRELQRVKKDLEAMQLDYTPPAEKEKK